MQTKIRRKRIRARLVDGTAAMKGYGSAFPRRLYVIDGLAIVRGDCFNSKWRRINPEVLALPADELVRAVACADFNVLEYNLYSRYIVDLCDEQGNVVETIR